MDADVETTRERPGRRREDGRRQEARRQPEASDQPGRAVRARPGGDSGHLSSRSDDAAAEAHRRARRRRVQGDHLGRGDRRAGRAARRAGRGRRSEVARLPDAAAPRPPRRARRPVPRAASARRAPVAFELFGDDVLRRANAISFGHEQLPTFDLARSRFVLVVRRRFPRHVELAGRAERGLRPDAAGPARASAARSCRSSRA